MRTCPDHLKELKKGARGSYFCSTPLRKEGDKVVEWCKYREFDDEQSIPEQPIRKTTVSGTQLVVNELKEIQRQLAELYDLIYDKFPK